MNASKTCAISRPVAVTAFMVAATALTGCAQFRVAGDEGHVRESDEQVSRVDKHSSFPAISRVNFEQVNLIEMIDPEEYAKKNYAALWPSEEKARGPQYDLVLSGFRSRTDLSDEAKRQRRNGVQDKIIAVSTSRCNVFKTFLRRQQADGNFYLGSATTVAGVLGALLPGARDVRNLAGAAGILSGIQAEFNQSYYSNLAAQVIIEGIDLRQSQLKEKLYAGARDKSVANYTMEAAIADALVFDGSCSALTGLIVAQDSIQQVSRPGPEAALNAMLYAQTMQAASKLDLSKPDAASKVEALRKIPGQGPLPLIASMVQKSAHSSLTLRSQEAMQMVGNLSSQIQHQADQLSNHYAETLVLFADGKKGDVTAKQVRETFTTWARDTILSPLTASKTGDAGLCMAAVTATTSTMSAAASRAALSPENTPERLTALKDLTYAEADVSVQVGKMQHLFDISVAQITKARAAVDNLMIAPAAPSDTNRFTLDSMTGVLAKTGTPVIAADWKCQTTK